MTKRQRIFHKYDGLCAYSGTKLDDDWQIDHVQPIIRDFSGRCLFPELNHEDNMVPVQKLINHYKRSLDLELFRTWYLGRLHERLKKLPKNPVVEKSKKRKEYMLKVANYFGIEPEKPFIGKFYFETIKNTRP